MALLDLVDQLIGDVLQGNLFTDTSRFIASVLQRPAGADSGIPNTDPRALNIPGPQHPPGVIPETIHSAIGSTTDPRPLNIPGPQHPSGVIPETNRAGDPVHSAIGSTTDPRPLNVPGPQHPPGVIPEQGAPGLTPTAGQPVHSRLGKTDDPRPLDIPGPQHPPGVIPEQGAPGLTPTAGQPVHSRLGKTDDPRLLDFKPEDPHPHAGKAGADPSKHVVYANPPTRPLHDHKPDYTNVPPDDPGGKDGHIVAGKRAQMYAGNAPPGEVRKSIQDQRADISTNTPLPEQRGGAGSIPQTQADPGIEKNPVQIPVGHTPQPREEREKLYEQANDRNRHGSPIQKLLDFHKSVEEDRSFAKGQSFDSTRRSDIYKKDAPNTLGGVETATPSNAAQVVSNIGGGPTVGAGVPTSRPTAGDAKTAEGQPPTIPLTTIEEGTGRREFAPPQGQLRNRGQTDHRQGNMYDDGPISLFDRGGSYAGIPGEVSALRFFDIFAIAHWLRNIGREGFPIPVVSREINDPITGGRKSEITSESIAKGIQWNVSQFLLAAFNPTDTQGYGALNALWNPLSLILSMVPLVRSTPVTNITVGATLAGLGFGGYKQNTLDSVSATPGGVAAVGVGERLVLMRQGDYVQVLDGNQIAQLRFANAGYEGPIVGSEQGTIQGEGLLASLFAAGAEIPGLAPGSVGDQVDGKVEGMGDQNLYSSERPYMGAADGGIRMPVNQRALEEKITTESLEDRGELVKLPQLFDAKAFPAAQKTAASLLTNPTNTYWKARAVDAVPAAESSEFIDAPGINAALTDVDFLGEELLPGSEESSGLAKKLIEEDAIYMPFMFQDLRDVEDQFLYFRAFLKPGLAETFTPDWQIERYYGRVDQVPIYMGTLRNLSVAFDVVAWGPADLPVMWRKLNKLQSMVYPFYNKGGFYKAGPIIRMRIGDLFANQTNKGIPGYITSMDWSYDDGIWNLKTDFRVPRKVSVSIGFTVVHDGNPGTYPYRESGDIQPADDVNAEPTDNTQGFTFGAGKVSPGKAENTLQINVSPAEIRKIFETVRNKSGE